MLPIVNPRKDPLCVYVDGPSIDKEILQDINASATVGVRHCLSPGESRALLSQLLNCGQFQGFKASRCVCVCVCARVCAHVCTCGRAGVCDAVHYHRLQQLAQCILCLICTFKLE